MYRTIVGSLVYLTITRLDIVYAMDIVNKLIVSPTTLYWDVVLHIHYYIQGTQRKSILFSSFSSLKLLAYSNVD